MIGSRWFLEFTTKDEASLHSIEEIIHASQTRYQKLEILRLGSYGKTLVLDGKMQSTEADEFIYHEALVHPSLISFGKPQKVLIAGGGEGATIREVLRYPSVESVHMIDLDEEVVEACKRYLHEWHQGCFEDRRVSLHFTDARKFIAESKERFDIIILDLPEPWEGGPAAKLYTREFYQEVSDHLSPEGLMVTQAATVSVNNYHAFTIVHNTLKQVFPIVRGYWTSVPSFYVPWGFIYASSGKDPKSFLPFEIKNRIKSLTSPLRFYNEEIHVGMLALPEFLKEEMRKEQRINTDHKPLSFY
jgi:spermidine synthase